MSDAAPKPGKNMGEPAPRIDARLKVTGKAPYPADVPVANLAHCVFAISPVARGKLVDLDVSEAEAVQGVLRVFTHRNLAGKLEPPKFGNTAASSIAPLGTTEIHHDGQPVALVVAETREAAEEGAALVKAQYETAAPSTTFDDEGTETIDAVGASEQFKEDVKAGDFDAAFSQAPVKIDARYSTPTQHHNPIELFSTTAAWDGDDLVIHEPSQNVTGWKNELARQLKVDPARIRIVSKYIGGAFGSKGPMTARTAIVAWAAREVGRPVRCVVARNEAYCTQTYRAETRHRIRIGANRDGKIAAFAHEGWELTSRPDPYVVGGTSATGRMYGYGSVLTKVRLVKADRNTPGYMRSPPETPYVYALENAMDEMAFELGMDPVEFRRVNDTMIEPIARKPFSSRSLMQCYDTAAQAFEWSKRNAAVGSMRDGDWLIGMGCATAIYPTNVAPCTVRLRLSEKGALNIQCGSHEIGTGVRTVAAQIASEELGIDLNHIEVEMGDSALPPAPVSGGSNSTASVCSAVMLGCAGVRNKLFGHLVEADTVFHGMSPSELSMKGGNIVSAKGKVITLKDAFAATKTGLIEEYAEFVPAGATPEAVSKLYAGQTEFLSGEKGDKVKYAFGAEFVEVCVHAKTREIRVPRIVGAFAAGRIMNTRTARSQLMGGMIWGISSALHEATELDRRFARHVNRDLQDYLIPVSADIRDVEVLLVSEVDRDVNPAGVKGLGELGNVGTAAAIASAVITRPANASETFRSGSRACWHSRAFEDACLSLQQNLLQLLITAIQMETALRAVGRHHDDE